MSTVVNSNFWIEKWTNGEQSVDMMQNVDTMNTGHTAAG